MGLAGVALLLGVAASSARAGTYDVQACNEAAGYANNSWKPSADRGMLAYTACPPGDDLRRGLVVRNEVGANAVRKGDGAVMRFRAPEGARLAAIAFDWDGYRANGEWSLGFSTGDGEWLSGCRAGSPSLDASCRLGDPRRDEPSLLSLRGEDAVRLEAACGRSAGCDASSTHDDSTGNTQARLRLTSAAVRVEDSSAPAVTPREGELWDGRWHRGTVSGAFSASDNVGIRATRLAVDGAAVEANDRSCDYTRRVPCADLPSAPARLDSTRHADGTHDVSATAIDAAGNAGESRRPLRIDNNAPGAVGDLAVEGGEAVRAHNSFDLTWTTPPGQAAPMARAHYRLCEEEDRSACATTSRPVMGGRLSGITVPRRGDYTLALWLEDEAGNVDPSTASSTVRLRFDDRVPASVESGIAKGGSLAASRTVAHRDRPRVRGRVLAPGAVVPNGRVVLEGRRRGAAGAFDREATAEIERGGRFELAAPRGSSRSLRVGFEGSDSVRPATGGELRLGVRALTTIDVNRHRSRNGGRVRFSGRLLGRPKPRPGKLIELQAHYRDRWRVFKVIRTDRRGRWSTRYRFGGTRGTVTYPFRAGIRREASYPYEPGVSRVVEVRVRER